MKSYLRQSASALRSVGCASRSLAISAQRQFGAAAAPGSVGAESFRVSAIAGAAMVSFAATSLVVPNSGVIMAAPAVALPGVASVWKKRAVGEMPIRTDLAAADDDEDDEEEEEAEDQEEELKDGQEEAAAQREVVQEGGKEEGPTAESEEERDQAVASDPETPAPEETQEQEPAVVLEVEEEDSKAVGPAGKTTVDEEGGPEVVAEEVQQEEPVPAEHKSVPEEQEKVEVASAVVVTEEKGEPNIPAPERDSEDPRYDGYIAIYLDAESQATLREKFPPRHATRGADRVLLVAKPNSDEYNEASDSFAKEIELNALVYVETDASQMYVIRSLCVFACFSLPNSSHRMHYSLIVDIDDESVRKVVEPSSLPHVTLSTATEGPGAATALEVAVARAAAGPEAAAKAAAGDAAEADTVSTILDASAVLARLQSRSVLTAMGVEESVEINSQAGATKAPRLTVPAGGAAWHGVLP